MLFPPSNFVLAGGPVDRVTASLRFFGNDIDPQEISRALGHQPTNAFRKPMSFPAGIIALQKRGSYNSN
jgi:hypothetical protein